MIHWQTYLAVVICQCVCILRLCENGLAKCRLAKKNGSSLKSFTYLWTTRYVGMYLLKYYYKRTQNKNCKMHKAKKAKMKCILAWILLLGMSGHCPIKFWLMVRRKNCNQIIFGPPKNWTPAYTTNRYYNWSQLVLACCCTAVSPPTGVLVQSALMSQSQEPSEHSSTSWQPGRRSSGWPARCSCSW